MHKRDNNISLIIGGPGLLLHLVALILPETEPMRPIALVVAAVMLLVGLTFYARAKGRHQAWGLFGLLGIVGLIVLACLKDHTTTSGAAAVPATGPR